jgi:protease PrsW
MISIGLTVAITLFLAVHFYLLDQDSEPLGAIFRAFIYGFIAAFLELFVFRLAVLKFFYGDDILNFTLLLNDEIENPTFNQVLISGIVIGGILKEGLKIFAYSQLIRKINTHINEPYDSVLYAIMLSLGFQLFENIIFVRTEPLAINFFGIVGLIKHLTTGIVMGYAHQKQMFGAWRSEIPINQRKVEFFTVATLIQVSLHIIMRVFIQHYNTLTMLVGLVVLAVISVYVYNLFKRVMKN